ncbi:MAG: adenylate/guanylate cyclase domain-containing protein [gamma proteobacterium symbiont of Taylorina sp.]|nr:adenylate/guanylate cyclase domain-containing protein [gamma proteobacterium symbiont of Taylorina sp.]
MLILFINYRGFHLLAKLMGVIIPNLQLFFLCWMLGTQSGLGMFFLGTPLVSVIIFSAKERIAIYALPLMSIILYLLAYFLFSTGTGILNPVNSLLVIVHVSSFIGCILIIGTIVLVYYKDIVHAEKLLKIEHKRSESLLQNILPKVIINRLKEGEKTIADRYDGITVVFADIVGFTVLSNVLSPKELVSKLNHIFSIFDKLVDRYELEKIKTIGDAYMAASGLPEARDDHAAIAADFALHLQDEMNNLDDNLGKIFKIRIGIHSGEAVAGIIGTRKFSYDVWGDTVNTASRMESHGISGEIQVSQSTYHLLKKTYIFEERGMLEIKGKGQMHTYLLKEKIN